MRTPPPTDLVEEFPRTTRLTPRERRRLVTMRRQAGAIDLRITVHARAAGEGAWQPVRSGTKVYRTHSALNAEQLIFGGPTAGRHFTATSALLEFYEQENTKGEKTE
jgi:hypothetical protein